MGDKMTLFAELSYKRVMVFIDFRNIYDSCRNFTGSDKIRMDLFRLTQILVGSRDLIGAYVFDATIKGVSADEETLIIHNELSDNGFRVMNRESMVKRNGDYVQKEVDVSLACEMLEHALLNHFDIAIVVSGDRDFVPAMQKVQAAGKRVEVAAFENVYSEECKRTADVYYLLNDIPFLSMSSPIVLGGTNNE